MREPPPSQDDDWIVFSSGYFPEDAAKAGI
jgi:hypothetical protein